MTARSLLYFMVLLSAIACASNKTAVTDDVPFQPEDALRQANDLIEEGRYENAREILESIKTRDVSQKYAILARLRIADTYYEDGSYDEATVEYESFLNLYPYHKYASYAQYKLAMCFYKKIKTVDVSYSWAQKALSEFQKLQRDYPRNPYMDIIDSRIKMCRNVLAEYEFYVGNFYFKKGSYDAAAGRFNGMIQNYPDSSKVPEALYYGAISYENLGQMDEAVQNLTVLIENFPTTDLAMEAKKIIESIKKEE